jgi:hypothetical protein
MKTPDPAKRVFSSLTRSVNDRPCKALCSRKAIVSTFFAAVEEEGGRIELPGVRTLVSLQVRFLCPSQLPALVPSNRIHRREQQFDRGNS